MTDAYSGREFRRTLALAAKAYDMAYRFCVTEKDDLAYEVSILALGPLLEKRAVLLHHAGGLMGEW